MSTERQQKRAISPQDLFQKLLSGNFKQLQCVDEVAQIKEQRQVLIKLIAEYRIQIEKRVQQFQKLQSLIIYKNKLRSQIQGLRNERLSINQHIQYQIERNKLSGIQITSQNQWRAQLDDLHHRNLALEGRLRQLNEYCLKIERKNIQLQNDKRIAEQYQSRVRINEGSVGCCYEMNRGLRERINARRVEQGSINKSIVERLRVKQQQSLIEARKKQQEITQRNRRKMASFHSRFRKQY